MTGTSIDQAIECRNTIRRKAFELAESGFFTDWAVELARSSNRLRSPEMTKNTVY